MADDPSAPQPAAHRSNDPISAELERALFKRFWTWLAIVGSFVLVVVSGFSIIASQAVRSLIDVRVKAELVKVADLEKRSLDSAFIINAAQARSLGAAEIAKDRSVEAEQAVLALEAKINCAPDVSSLIKDTNSIVDSILKKQDFIDRINDAIASRAPSTIAIATGSRALGTVYHNTQSKTVFVIVSAYNTARGCTMFGNASEIPTGLPLGQNGSNGTTTVSASFIDARFSSSMTFVVPAGCYYDVTTDCGSEALGTWTEVTL